MSYQEFRGAIGGGLMQAAAKFVRKVFYRNHA
jgi:hypothetical protein